MTSKHITQHLQFIARSYPMDIIAELRPYIERFIELGACAEQWTDDVYERVLTRQRARDAFATLMLWTDIALWQLKQQHNHSDLAEHLTRYVDDHIRRRTQPRWRIFDREAQTVIAQYFGQNGSQHVGQTSPWINGLVLEVGPSYAAVPDELHILKQRLGHKMNTWFEHTILYGSLPEDAYDPIIRTLGALTTPRHWLTFLSAASIHHLCLQEVIIGDALERQTHMSRLLNELNTQHVTTLELLMCVPSLHFDDLPMMGWYPRLDNPPLNADAQHAHEHNVATTQQYYLNHMRCDPDAFARFLPLERIEHIILDSPLLWAYPEAQQGLLSNFSFNQTKKLTIRADRSAHVLGKVPRLLANLSHLNRLQCVRFEGGFKPALTQRMVEYAHAIDHIGEVQVHV